jgi:hypothetical protein
LHPIQTLFCAFQRDETEALREDFVSHDRGIVVHVDFLYGEGGDFGEEDAAEGVGERGVEAD